MESDKIAVLVVDDEPVVRQSCERVLSNEGRVVTCATDGLEGLRKVRNGIYDVVLVDLKMPNLDGMQLLKSIRSEKPNVPVIIVTGYPTVNSAVDALKSGAFDYLVKPFTPEELSTVVNRAYQRKRSSVGPADAHRCRLMTLEEFPQFVKRMTADHTVWGPKARGKSFVFDRITSPEEIELCYPSTILPPKKLFYPQRQVLMRYSMGDNPKIEVPREEPKSQVIMGLHPCDLHALELLDRIMSNENSDPVYRARRKRSLLIGVDCKPDDNCFCYSMGTNEPPAGTDLFITRIGGRYLIEMGTSAGERFLGEYGDTDDATAADINAVRLYRDRKRDLVKRSVNPDGLSEIIERRFEDGLWEEITEKCLGCGSCSLVCPTCYCFNVTDSVSLDLKSGRRDQHWDSCILYHFALVAGGHNFRKTRADRLRYRYYHKFRGIPEEYGSIGCVGCGRCIRSCPAGMEITEAIETIRGDGDVGNF